MNNRSAQKSILAFLLYSLFVGLLLYLKFPEGINRGIIIFSILMGIFLAIYVYKYSSKGK